MEEYTKKQFTYRGKSIEELKALDVREFAKLVQAKERRNILRNFQKVEDFINRSKTKESKGKKIRTHQRDLIVTPQMVGWKVQIYNGKEFMQVELMWEMLGHKFGEFAPTRSKIKHSKTGVGATKGSKHKSKK